MHTPACKLVILLYVHHYEFFHKPRHSCFRTMGCLTFSIYVMNTVVNYTKLNNSLFKTLKVKSPCAQSHTWMYVIQCLFPIQTCLGEGCLPQKGKVSCLLIYTYTSVLGCRRYEGAQEATGIC